MALLFNTKNLEVQQPEPMSRWKKYFGGVILEILIIALVVAAFWRIFLALGIF